MLGLLFNLFLNCLSFYWKKNIRNFVDDNKIYGFHINLQTIFKDLGYDMPKCIDVVWFKVNSMKPNSSVVLRGLTIYNRLAYKDHINILSGRGSFKLHALRRIRKYWTTDKAKLLSHAFIDSQFNYASIIRMFCHKNDNLKIKKSSIYGLKNFLQHYESYEELLLRSKYQFIKSSYVYWLLRFLKA